MSQGSQFFEGKGAVQEALLRITGRLNELGIPYCVAGGMALFQHGYRRFTEDVDILVTREGLKEIHARLDGLGYLPPFPRSKNLRDTENGVRVEFLVTGDFPGDGKPKPLAFPDPTAAGTLSQGITFLSLPRLIELKLASGMTNPGRIRDLSDVMELIKLRNLPESYAEELNPYVQSKFREALGTRRPPLYQALARSSPDTAHRDLGRSEGRTAGDVIPVRPDASQGSHAGPGSIER